MDQTSEVPANENSKGGKFADNYTFSPVSVTMRETAGVIFLGLLAIFLFIELRRSQKRYDDLINQISLKQ